MSEPPEQPYQAPAPFAPPTMRGAPLNELLVTGRTTYPVPPMVPVAYPPPYPPPYTQPMAPPTGGWQPGVGWTPYAPSRQRAGGSRVMTLTVVGAVVVALLVIVISLVVSNAGPSRHTLSLPTSAGEYTRVSTISGSHISTMFGAGGTFGSIPLRDLEAAKIGIYGRGSQVPSALFIGFDADESPPSGSNCARATPMR